MAFCMVEFSGRHGPEAPSDLDIRSRSLLQTAAFDKTHSGVDDCFGRESVGGAGFKSEHVARQVKCTDLTPPV